MKLNPVSWLAFVALSFASISSAAQVSVRDRFAVTQTAVEKAITDTVFNGSSEPGVHVHLLTDIVASTPSPDLDVMALELLPSRTGHTVDSRRFAVRLICHLHNSCLPFYAELVVPQGITFTTLTASTHTAVAAAFRPQPTGSNIIRRGAHATLVFNDGASQITVPIITLQDAVVGDTIHVASLDHRHIYSGQAVSATLLKGEF